MGIIDSHLGCQIIGQAFPGNLGHCVLVSFAQDSNNLFVFVSVFSMFLSLSKRPLFQVTLDRKSQDQSFTSSPAKNDQRRPCMYRMGNHLDICVIHRLDGCRRQDIARCTDCQNPSVMQQHDTVAPECSQIDIVQH